jgi:hypothetical protein
LLDVPKRIPPFHLNAQPVTPEAECFEAAARVVST